MNQVAGLLFQLGLSQPSLLLRLQGPPIAHIHTELISVAMQVWLMPWKLPAVVRVEPEGAQTSFPASLSLRHYATHGHP